jgi:ATP-dependent DNA helicase
MTSSSVTGADTESQKSTPASSPPPATMDDRKDDVSMELQAEEDRMRVQREKQDAKHEAEMEKERQEDLKSGKEVLDKKFQQLEFLMNKSKVSIRKFALIET